MSTWPISYDDVLAAERRIRPYMTATPLRSYVELDDALGMRVLVKHENHAPTNAFKVRNGLSVVTAMTEADRRRGVVGATMGNYGQGLAWAGRAMGVTVTICVPHGVNPDKLAAMRGLGARIITEGSDYDDAIAVMDRLVHDEGLYPAHGVNHPAVPAGAGTIMLEILEQAKAMNELLDAMVIVIGGGSQAVGAMTVLRHRGRECPVFGVQAEGAATIHDAWHDRKPRIGPTPTTFAEGMATRQTYELTFDALCEGLAGFVLVSDAELAGAMRLLWQATHNIAEPAGAGGIAALGKLGNRLRGKSVGVIISGANVDTTTLRQVLNHEI